MMKKIFVLSVLLLSLLIISSCAPTHNGLPTRTSIDDLVNVFSPDSSSSLKHFSSDDSLKSFLTSNDGLDTGYMLDSMFVETRALTNEAKMAPSLDGASASSESSYSETNNQVSGVDEADLVKTDGKFIYLVNQVYNEKSLFILSAGDNASIISVLNLSFHPRAIFIDGDRLAVFGWGDNDFLRLFNYRSHNSFSFMEIYNISDRSSPSLVKSFKFEGSYDTARLVDGFIYLITYSHQSINYPRPVYFVDKSMNYVSPESISYFKMPYDNSRLANIFSIDLSNAKMIDSKSLFVEYNSNLYASKNNLYLSYTKRINEYKISQKVMLDLVLPLLSKNDSDLIDRINAVDSDILSNSEKLQKIVAIAYNHIYSLDSSEQESLESLIENETHERLSKFKYREYSVISKFSFDDGVIDEVGSAIVPGSLLNQFSMDEYDAVLRLVTHINSHWDSFSKNRTESSNFVITLSDKMKLLDELDNVAPGERIYSSRFIADRLYLVTFKNVDPFFVIDLSNPKSISILGKLKLPGYSSYLHPYSDNIIIGLGRDASDNGRVRGLKISLFNVSDVNNPTELTSFKAKGRYSSSVAEYEHKAFLFDRSKNLLVIPARSYDWKSSQSYNGALVFNISESSIVLRGLIDHSTGSNNYYGSSVERSLFIDDYLYTISRNLLRINRLDNLSSVKNISLSLPSKGPYEVY